MINRKSHRRSAEESRPLTIGAVNYLNSKPLIEGLAARAPGAVLKLDYPSRLAEGLARGTLDVALIPSVEAFSDPDYEVVSDACVAARGPVLSVKLYFRKPPGEVRSLALDEGSRTSAALARILLAERYGVLPDVRPFPLEAPLAECHADAILMIGDRAMHPPRELFVAEWDLGDEWWTWTGLPFVFAMWVTRREVALGQLPSALSAARDEGVAHIATIAERESSGLHLDPALVQRYLTSHLHFQLGSAERSGLRLFHRLAARCGLARDGGRLIFRPSSPAQATVAR